MKISIVSFTRTGAKKNLELGRLLFQKKHQAVSYSWHTHTGRKLVPFQSFDRLMADLWREEELFLILTDVRHAVMILTPYLRRPGPAIFVMDEAGRFVIPFSFGQKDGMEDWCAWFSGLAGAAAVLTSAEEPAERFELTKFAQKNRLYIQDLYRVRTVAACLAEGKPVGFYSDYPVDGVYPEGIVRIQKGDSGSWAPEVGISVTDDWEAPHFAKECRMFPQNVALGICFPAGDRPEKNAARQAALRALSGQHISRQRVFAVFAVQDPDQKQLAAELADALDVPCFTYTESQLLQCAGISGGGSVGKEEALCGACSLLGSGRGKEIVSVREAGIAISLHEMEMDFSF